MKKLLLVVAIILAALQTFSQTDPIREKLDSIFQYVDKLQIPTGYLKEYGAEFIPIHRFNGVLTDSNVIADIDCWRAAYTDITTAKILSYLPAMIQLTAVNTTIDGLRNTAAAPVALLYGNYASLRDDALNLNLFTINNQQIFDVPNRSQNPYVSNTLFAAASINKKFTNTVTFTYNPSMYFTNTSVTVAQLYVDFKDGQGYQLIPANGTVSKTYTDSSSTKVVDFAVQLSTGTYLFCHSGVDVIVTGSGAANRYAGADPYATEVPVPVVAGEGLEGDVMQIRYSQNNPTRTSSTPHLHKPLIYVEGYDVSGKYDIMNLIKNETIDKGEWVNLALIPNGYDFMHDLDDVAGYDLVFVNYNTLRSFEDNTKMLQHVIEWVKQDKAAGGSTEPNVIIGTSAGGILARYTLARMTKIISSTSTDTRLLITHDSPHQGANVPLAFQHFLYDLGNQKVLGNKIKDVKEDLKNFYELNTKPATAQLLRARVIDEDGNVVMNTFLNGSNSPYQQMITFAPSDNVPMYRFIATAQGSQCGVPVMPANNLPLADYDGDFAVVHFVLPTNSQSKYYLKTQLTALPGNGSQSEIEYFKYSRRYSIWGIGFGTKILNEVSRANPAGFTDWDAAPGSTESINDRTGGSLSTGLAHQNVPLYVFLFVNVRAGLNINVTQDLFSFVSTTSALDAPQGTPPNMPYVFSNTGTSGTTSQKYIAQEMFTGGSSTFYNQSHTTFTARNSKWIYAEMENQPFNDCVAACSNLLIITGSQSVCSTTSSYSVNSPAGATVVWSISPQNVATIDPSTGVVTKVNSGSATITATVTSCSVSISVQKPVTVGTPDISGTYTNTFDGSINNLGYYPGITNPACTGYTINTNMQIYNATYVTWTKVSSSNVVGYSRNGNDISFYLFGNNQNVVFQLDASNGCGTVTNQFKWQSGNCGRCNNYVISPNPANTSSIVVEPNIGAPCGSAAPQTSKNTTSTRVITEVRLYDNAGNLKKVQKENKSKQSTIDVSGFKTGVYFVEISDGDFKERQQVIIGKQ